MVSTALSPKPPTKRYRPFAAPIFASGFDKPLQLGWQFDLNTLRDKLVEHAPVGKPRPIGFRIHNKDGEVRTYTYTRPQPLPGRLRDSFKQPGALRLTPNMDGVIIRTEVPYARIQDQGGTIPAHTQPPGAPNMMFRAGGRIVFTRHRGPITIRPQHYIQRAFDDWLQDHEGVNVQLDWKD